MPSDIEADLRTRSTLVDDLLSVNRLHVPDETKQTLRLGIEDGGSSSCGMLNPDDRGGSSLAAIDLDCFGDLGLGSIDTCDG